MWKGFSGQSKHLFLGRYLEKSSTADTMGDLNTDWSTQASPPDGEFHRVEGASKAPRRVGTMRTARHPTLQACTLAHTHVEVSKLGATRFMFLTSPEKQFSQREGNVDLRHTVISQLHPSSALDLHQVLGGKKGISFEESIIKSAWRHLL